MRAAIDKLRSVFVALVHDGHTSAALVREVLDYLEREDAKRRDEESHAEQMRRAMRGIPDARDAK